MTKTASCIAWSLVSPLAFEALKYLQALQRYNSDIQAHLLNSEIRQVVHRNLKTTNSVQFTKLMCEGKVKVALRYFCH